MQLQPCGSLEEEEKQKPHPGGRPGGPGEKKKDLTQKRDPQFAPDSSLGVGFSEPMTLPTQWVSSGMEVHSIIPVDQRAMSGMIFRGKLCFEL